MIPHCWWASLAERNRLVAVILLGGLTANANVDEEEPRTGSCESSQSLCRFCLKQLFYFFTPFFSVFLLDLLEQAGVQPRPHLTFASLHRGQRAAVSLHSKSVQPVNQKPFLETIPPPVSSSISTTSGQSVALSVLASPN